MYLGEPTEVMEGKRGGSGEDGGVANIYNIRVYKDFKLKVNSNAYHLK